MVQPLAFLIYFTCAVAETNRLPFDIPEAESELVSGFHVEYSGMRFAIFFLAEYANMFVVCAIATTVFLGGWQGPLLAPWVWFLLKTYFLLFVMIWLRWTLARVRVDQLMHVAWKVLLPLAFVNLGITGLLVAPVRGAGSELRGAPGDFPAGSSPPGGLSQDDGHRGVSGGNLAWHPPWMVNRGATPGFSHLLHLCRGGDQPAPLRYPGGGVGTRVRVSCRV